MESALSPNTAAFLQYISSQLGPNEDKSNEAAAAGVTEGKGVEEGAFPAGIQQQLATTTSLPPSAFFQIPSESDNLPTPASKSASPIETKPGQSLQQQNGRSVSISESEEGSPASASNGRQNGNTNGGPDGLHKRKAGLHHQIMEDDGEEDETDSDAMTGHEDKKQHHNNKAGRKGGRKSGGHAEDGPPGKEMSKAARRKEQNRAAQKAFRERREARVNDLEAKVAELEAKSYSSSVENENLRSILKRLQEENVSLKQSAFTFAMPRGGSTSNASPSNTNGGSPLHRVSSKPPTPPYSQADEPLKSVNDPSPINTNVNDRLPHRQSSSGMSGLATSPESMNSAISSGSSRNPLLNGNSPMRFDSFSTFSHETGITPPSVASDNKSDLEALWASFYPSNNSNNGNGQQPTPNQAALPLASPNPLTQFLAAQMAQGKLQLPTQTPQIPSQSQPPAFNPSAPNMAYRDPSTASVNAGPAPDQDINWGNMGNTSIDDFLASLTGSNNGSTDDNPVSAVDDDTFNQQLQAILAGGGFDQSVPGLNGGVTGNGNAFSPTNYLNMSPDPLNSISNSASPQSALVSGTSNSNSASPESSNASSVPPKELSPDVKPQPTWSCGEIVNVVDEKGNVIKPSDLWVKMGMQQQDNVDNLLIDDLCDQMRAKAKCTDAGAQLSVDDLHHMMSYEKPHQQKRMDDLKDKYGWGAVFGPK